MDDFKDLEDALMDTMQMMMEAMNDGDQTFNTAEFMFHDADGNECAMWDQDVTLFTIMTQLVSDPRYLRTALYN